MNGTVFDIQRFSVHDGPGIRTTVFMKGCPLRCLWCHNPEGLEGHAQMWYEADKCIRCGRCGTRTDPGDAAHCPTGALKVCGKQMTEEDVLRAVMRDLPFYGADGGVTFSGGECLLQADFVRAVLHKVKEQGVSTAVDTCGYVAWEQFEKVLDVCDLFLYDIKMADEKKHKACTGVEPALIWENLHRLSACRKPVWIRVPVIPGVNDSEEEMRRIGQLIRPLDNIGEITLIPYHTLGKSKYEALGMPCLYHTDKAITREKLALLERIVKEG